MSNDMITLTAEQTREMHEHYAQFNSMVMKLCNDNLTNHAKQITSELTFDYASQLGRSAQELISSSIAPLAQELSLALERCNELRRVCDDDDEINEMMHSAIVYADSASDALIERPDINSHVTSMSETVFAVAADLRDFSAAVSTPEALYELIAFSRRVNVTMSELELADSGETTVTVSGLKDLIAHLSYATKLADELVFADVDQDIAAKRKWLNELMPDAIEEASNLVKRVTAIHAFLTSAVTHFTKVLELLENRREDTLGLSLADKIEFVRETFASAAEQFEQTRSLCKEIRDALVDIHSDSSKFMTSAIECDMLHEFSDTVCTEWYSYVRGIEPSLLS